MAADLGPMTLKVQRTRGIVDSATVYINDSAARIQAAVAAALALGATAEELAPVQAEVDAMNTQADVLAAAIAANP